MDVLYFHQHFSTPQGSTGIRSYEMARRLVASGHTVTMVCGSYRGGNTGLDQPFERGRREGQVDGLHIIEFDLAYSNRDGFVKRALLFLVFALRSIGVAMTRRYDVLFATSTPLTAGIPGIFARWLRRKPFVFEVRDLWPELPKAMGVISNPLVLWLMSVLEWCSYHSANQLIALAPGMVDGIAARGISRERIAMIPNGCDFSIFEQSDQAWRPDGVGDDELLAIFTGTHGMANGLNAVLDAALELKRRQRSDIKIALVGDGKLKAELQQRAATEGLDNLIFHDPVDKATLSGLMAGADLGLQTLSNVPAFYFGTSPNKFFDYISAGLPVLNNYPGWLAAMIEDSACGYAVSADNAVAFADALIDAADHRDKLAAMGTAASALAHRSFDRNVLGQQFVETLAESAMAKPLSLLKRAVDILGAASGLLLLAPIIILLALVVRVKLGSPVLFRQRRPGLHGKSFEMVKFRSMNDARGPDGGLLPDSQRLTRTGRLLRATSLDELPELWNVLKGDMSLVGPRPLLEEYLPLYSAEQKRRHYVRPGLTGWAQVNGRNALSWEQKFELDVWYVDNQSVWLDIKILFMTVKKVFAKEGISGGGEVTMSRFEGSSSSK